MKTASFYTSRILLVALGVGLGFAARFLLGAPEDANQRKGFDNPVTIEDAREFDRNEMLDLPFVDDIEDPSFDSLVPPIRLPAIQTESPYQVTGSTDSRWDTSHEDFAQGTSAFFEPHGESVCASGCAASRHPTTKLTRLHFINLLSNFANEPLDQTSSALEELLFFGRQTRKLIDDAGWGSLDSKRRDFLSRELEITHAKVEIRVVDESGEIRTWLQPTSVPFDRRHVFEMETQNLQSLVTSGTVKRVGLNHIWVRL